MTRQLSLQILSVFLFVIFCFVGFRIAAGKPLWMDELWTQQNAVQSLSAGQLVFGRNTGEGNNAPLFYLIQKWTRWVPATFVSADLLGEAISADFKKQILLRIVPVLAVSGALAFLFYFFAFEFSVLAGLYALLCALASPMVWLYWAEARPYPLVLSLTIVQSLILVKMAQDPQWRQQRWIHLAVLNFLLVFTSYLSVIQVIASAGVLWLCGERAGKKLLWVLAPVGVALFYRFQGVHEAYELWFQWSYFFDNIPLERLAFYGMAVLFLLWGGRKPEAGEAIEVGHRVLRHTQFLLFLLIGFSLILLTVKMQETHVKQLGLHSRFFIALTSVGIVEQALLAVWMLRAASRDGSLRMMAIVATGLLAVIGLSHTALQAIRELKIL